MENLTSFYYKIYLYIKIKTLKVKIYNRVVVNVASSFIIGNICTQNPQFFTLLFNVL